MSERFVSGVSAKIALYKYSSFPFLSFFRTLHCVLCDNGVYQFTLHCSHSVLSAVHYVTSVVYQFVLLHCN